MNTPTVYRHADGKFLSEDVAYIERYRNAYWAISKTGAANGPFDWDHNTDQLVTDGVWVAARPPASGRPPMRKPHGAGDPIIGCRNPGQQSACLPAGECGNGLKGRRTPAGAVWL